MIQPRTETEDFLISITKICETLIEQIHRKAEETLEVKLTKPRERFHFNPLIQIKGDWMIGLTSLEVYNFIFNINQENNKYQLFTDTFDEFSFEELKDELEEILDISNVTDDHLEDETIRPRIFQGYWKLGSEKSDTDGYIILIMGYDRSPFRDFESYLRIVIGLEEDDIWLILKQYTANFVTYELDPSKYTLEDLQEAVYPLGDHGGTLQIEYDDLNKKSKLCLSRFGSTFGTWRFDEKSFFYLIGFRTFWNYKPTNAIHSDGHIVYTSNKNLNINTINKIDLKCNNIDGSIQDGVRQPILFSFVLDKPSGYKVFCEPKTIHCKKMNVFWILSDFVQKMIITKKLFIIFLKAIFFSQKILFVKIQIKIFYLKNKL